MHHIFGLVASLVVTGKRSGQRERFSLNSPQFGRGSTDCGPLNGFNASHLFNSPNSFPILNNSFGSSVTGIRNGSFRLLAQLRQFILHITSPKLKVFVVELVILTILMVLSSHLDLVN